MRWRLWLGKKKFKTLNSLLKKLPLGELCKFSPFRAQQFFFFNFLWQGIAIFAFATTAGYYSEFRVEWTLSQNKTCNTSHLLEKDNLEILAKFEYPFDEEVYYLSGKLTACCHKNHIEHDSLAGKFKSQSQFFVFTGVAAFLYCLVASAYYVLFEDQEQSMYSTDVGKFSFVVIVRLIIDYKIHILCL